MLSGLGWLRAVARSYNYSYNQIELGSNFHKHLISCGVTMGWLGWLRAAARGYSYSCASIELWRNFQANLMG